MSAVVLRAEGLGKRYRIGRLVRYKALRDTLTEALTAPWRRLSQTWRSDPTGDEAVIWALKGVSFTINRGEVVGIIGRNGAGKSTLLKILSRITEPTEGRAEIHGRVGSLLEVGTGFHPELTGRENIYLNGAILGMRKREIDRKFDEIVAFAEIEKFLDTAVKFYSNGMYIRLGFAVAAHLEPEVLVVDEVLAVGDTSFQQKCLDKMGNVAHEGRTVLFVSHNLAAVRQLCEKTMWIDKGQVALFGSTDSTVQAYLSSIEVVNGEFRASQPDRTTTKQHVRLLRVSVRNHQGAVADVVASDAPVTVELEYEVTSRIENVRVGYRLVAADGTVVYTASDTDPEGMGTLREPGTHVSTCTIPANLLNGGRYYITAACDRPMQDVLFFVEHAVAITVQLTGGVGGAVPDGRLGVVRPSLSWELRRLESRDSG